MEWSEEDVQQLFLAHGQCDGGKVAQAKAIATRAVELVGGRGGMMTAEELEDSIDGIYDMDTLEAGKADQRVRQHIAAQGTRIAVLEQENAALLHAGRELLAVCTESMPHGEATQRRHNAQFALESPGAGAALLEEHKRALVRARNEGIERVAKAFEDNAMSSTAADVRRLKEAEP